MRKIFIVAKRVFTIPELRQRIITTLGLLLVFRLGAFIVLPGINPAKITDKAKGILSLLDTFLGGAFSNVSIFALGVMPYISASIAIQLLTIAIPYFQKLQREGQSGRKTLGKLTKILTVVFAVIQSATYIGATVSDEVLLISRPLFLVVSLFVLPAGTMACVWIGDRITDKGIGNGTSMLIMIGIISSLPGAFLEELLLRGGKGSLLFILELVILFFVVVSVVMFTQAVRKVPLQYAKQMATGGSYTGQRQYLPLKLNSAGVMPIIFAQVLMFLPALLANFLASRSEMMTTISKIFDDFTGWQYNLVFSILIVTFTYLYTAVSINPLQIADDLKRSSSFIPGIKPGKPTAAFIDDVLSKITLPGSLFLAIIAILPGFAYAFGLSRSFSKFFGGTSLIIMVGVVLDSLQQIQSYLLMYHYDNMLDPGSLQERS